MIELLQKLLILTLLTLTLTVSSHCGSYPWHRSGDFEDPYDPYSRSLDDTVPFYYPRLLPHWDYWNEDTREMNQPSAETFDTIEQNEGEKLEEDFKLIVQNIIDNTNNTIANKVENTTNNANITFTLDQHGSLNSSKSDENIFSSPEEHGFYQPLGFVLTDEDTSSFDTISSSERREYYPPLNTLPTDEKTSSSDTVPSSEEHDYHPLLNSLPTDEETSSSDTISSSEEHDFHPPLNSLPTDEETSSSDTIASSEEHDYHPLLNSLPTDEETSSSDTIASSEEHDYHPLLNSLPTDEETSSDTIPSSEEHDYHPLLNSLPTDEETSSDTIPSSEEHDFHPPLNSLPTNKEASSSDTIPSSEEHDYHPLSNSLSTNEDTTSFSEEYYYPRPLGSLLADSVNISTPTAEDVADTPEEQIHHSKFRWLITDNGSIFTTEEQNYPQTSEDIRSITEEQDYQEYFDFSPDHVDGEKVESFYNPIYLLIITMISLSLVIIVLGVSPKLKKVQKQTMGDSQLMLVV